MVINKIKTEANSWECRQRNRRKEENSGLLQEGIDEGGKLWRIRRIQDRPKMEILKTSQIEQRCQKLIKPFGV